jgi:hypothetical protein
VVTGVVFPGEKRLELEVDRSPPSNKEVENEWSYTSTPPYAFIV